MKEYMSDLLSWFLLTAIVVTIGEPVLICIFKGMSWMFNILKDSLEDNNNEK